VKRALVLTLVACQAGDWNQYTWDERSILCSQPFDDLSKDAPWEDIESQLAYAAERDTVALIHAHRPMHTVSIEAIERVLRVAEENRLAFVTFPELVPGEPRAGVAIAFDDQWIDEWYGVRDLLKAHDAHVTFFVTRLHLWTDEGLAMLAELSADGHAIEAHSVNHLEAPQYVRDHGAQQYLDEEALPSIERLRALDYPVTAYAFPFGDDHADVDDAILESVKRIRVSPGACPH
jgi:hypothetical protein